jgi:hypothetical protein
MALALAAFAVGAPANATVHMFEATLSGAAEFVPNASPGTGDAFVTFDDVTHLLSVEMTFADLIGTTTASHIHAPTAEPREGNAGVATQVPFFVDFPLGVQAGSYAHVFDTTLASTWNPAFIAANGGTTAGAEAALLTAMNKSRAYVNIHTTQFPGGEIRGFLDAVPEPAAWALMLLGFGLAGGAARMWRARAAI